MLAVVWWGEGEGNVGGGVVGKLTCRIGGKCYAMCYGKLTRCVILVAYASTYYLFSVSIKYIIIISPLNWGVIPLNNE